MNAFRFNLLLLCLVSSLLLGFSPADKTVKATWIWQTERIATDKEEILSFARKNKINLLYLRIDPNKPADYYRPFIKDAHAAGIEVHALAGHPVWALKKNRYRLLNLANWVNSYNAAAAEEEQFAGVHVDIEPYLLPDWNRDKQTVLAEWMGNMEAFINAAKQETDLQVSADLAVWFDDTAIPENPDIPFSKWMISQFDHVTLMAYRDTVSGANGIAENVKNELKEADELGKKVIIAVNTKEAPGEPHTTFYEEGPEEMEYQLDLIRESIGEHRSYAGVAVHDYRHWKKIVGLPSRDRGGLVKATYVWHAELAINEPDEIISFAKENGVNLLYTRLDLDQPFQVYSSFVEKATAAGIEVHAMGGHPIWAFEKNRYRMLRLVHWVQAYNKHVAKDQQFRGIHLDIEPYVLPEWNRDKESVLRQWMSNIAAFVQETKNGSDLETSVDLAVWLDATAVPDNPDISFSKWMISQLDHVALMAFRDRAEGPGGIVAVVQDEMADADELGKKLIISVEMKESEEGDHITFYEEGKAEMERQLELLPKHLGVHPSYAGNAVHAYDYWKYGKE
jgi:hypothetical protein